MADVLQVLKIENKKLYHLALNFSRGLYRFWGYDAVDCRIFYLGSDCTGGPIQGRRCSAEGVVQVSRPGEDSLL